MIEIKTPDGGIARFPDGTPDATIKGALRKAFGGPQEQPSALADIAKTAPGKILQGIAAVPGAIGGLPGLSDRLLSNAIGFATGRSGDEVQADVRAREALINQGMPFSVPKPQDVITTEKIMNAVKPITGEIPEPQTTAGKYVGAALSMLPAALAGNGTILQRAVQGTAAGVASEGAGELTQGTAAEPWARALAAILAGGGTALAQRRPPEQVAAAAMGNIDNATLAQAARLRLEAQNRGIDLSWPEAIQHITNNGTRLTDLQRVVENSDGGGAQMRQFYADRPAQIDAAARQEFGQIAPQPMIPERLGPRVQQAADADITGVRQGINQQTRPLYQAAEAQAVFPPNHPVLQNPAFRQALDVVRNDPVIGPTVAHLPDNSIGVIDAVQKQLKARATALDVPGEGLNPHRAALTRDARRQAVTEAQNQSPEYLQARQQQARLRDQYLNPLEEGPTGKASQTTDVGAQSRAIFPNKPQAQSEIGTARAIRGIGRTDPAAAEGIVRQHLETAFNEATQRLQSGPNQAGGAKFSAVIAGNPQQRANLSAAIRALPNGSTLWRGFNRFLDIMEATGRRPAPNSMTTFNAQIQKELERGGAVGEAASIAASPQKALGYIRDRYTQFRLGRGTAELARLFTQGNLRDFQRILRSGPNSPEAIGIMVRLISQANAGANTPTPAN